MSAQLLLHTADFLTIKLCRETGWDWTVEGPIAAEVYGKHGPFAATGYVLGLHGCPGLWPSGVEQLADNRGLFHSPTVSLRISAGSRFVQEGAVLAFLREVSK